uniref:Putative LAGLIDADG homing endonuclease n=1 Tax=Oogamochlamys gigantea TaxID=158507 RepID=A0A0S2LN65_9CHLO|nr:putative LAGLIDADG homing endonuclease [Oogamochlamys gigantea]ALO62832.1 putative LAGLIDADG homing endonuclease [Oogamochlamys gigantea]
MKILKSKKHYLAFMKKKNIIIGSSETKREAPFLNILNKQKNRFRFFWCYRHIRNFFSFTEYMKNYSPAQIKKLRQSYLEWFTGFVEGDGCFYAKHEPNNRIRLGFEISQKDPKVLYEIKKNLGFGRVYQKIKSDGQTYWVYFVSDKKGCLRILSLFNGNFILPKRRKQFNRWVQFAKKAGILPKNFVNKHSNILKGPTVSLNTGWLSGFVDAEACFYANLSTPSPRSRLSHSIKQKMHITQKSVQGEEKILAQIAQLFLSKAKVAKCRGKAKKFEEKTNYYRIEISSLESHQKIREYLNKFKLKTNKKIAYLQWCRVVLARELGHHLEQSRLPRLKRLCKAINRNVKKFENHEFVVL